MCERVKVGNCCETIGAVMTNCNHKGGFRGGGGQCVSA